MLKARPFLVFPDFRTKGSGIVAGVVDQNFLYPVVLVDPGVRILTRFKNAKMVPGKEKMNNFHYFKTCLAN
jgi:hypothetical protein